MSNQVKVKDVGSAGGKKSQGGGAAGGKANLTAEQEARRSRAAAALLTISKRWTGDTLGLFDIKNPPDASYAPEAFKRKAYELYSHHLPNGMNTLTAASEIEPPDLLLQVLTVDEERTKYGEALLQALDEMTKDKPHLAKMGEAIEDLRGGGDVKYNTPALMAHYAGLTVYGKRWLLGAPRSHLFTAYITGGRCAEHGAMEATHITSGQRPSWLDSVAETGMKQRIAACKPILDMLFKGAMGAAASDSKAGAGTDPNADPNAAKTPDPNQVRADELLKKIKDLIAKHEEDSHGERHLTKNELKKLIADIKDEKDEVKDRLYSHPGLMQQLNMLDPDQTTKLIGSMNTLDGLYDRLYELVPILKVEISRGPAGGTNHRDITGRPAYLVPPEVYTTLSNYLLARPGDEMAPARMRVLQHEKLMAHFVDPMQKDEKEKIFRLVANGTLEPTLLDNVREAAKKGEHANCARALMKLSSDAPKKLEALKDDHIFRKEIEKVDKTIMVDGFDVNPYHLCLAMWGLQPLSTDDPGVFERQREVNPTGEPARPLTIEQRIQLEDELLNPYARRLRSEIAERVVDDDDMMSICRRYEKDQAKFEAMWKQLRKAPGPALVDHYNWKYNRDLRGEVNEYVSDEEELECNRILGFTKESSTTGIIGGKANVHGAPPEEKGPPKIVDLDQRLREVKRKPDDVPLTQVTNDFAYNIAREWLHEIPGRDQYAGYGIGMPQYYYPGIEKDALLEKWRVYKKLIDDNKTEIVKYTPWHESQVHAIEFLQNAVLYLGGDLATKIQRFYGMGEATQILSEMKLTPKDISDRAAEARKDQMAKDPGKGVEAQARLEYAAPAKLLFEEISRLPPSLKLDEIGATVERYKHWRIKVLEQAPVIAGPPTPSIEERPPKSFKGFYRLEYGIDPELHIARTLRSFKERNVDVSAAAKAFEVEAQVAAATVQAPDEKVVINQDNQHLVTHGFTEKVAHGIAADTWKAIHDGTRFNVVITKLYTDFSKEEQRLIRIAFRQLSGGIDLAFYIQQALLRGRTTTIGGEGTEEAKKVTPKTELDIGESDPTKLQTYLTAAQHGTVDVHALLKAAVANADIDQIFRVCEEAEAEDRAKILEDRKLLADIQAVCDTVARDRVYKTLTNQADLVDRLYQRADGWGTDEKGMREDIKFYVKKLRKQFGKEIREREDRKKQAKESAMDSQAISEEVDARIREACLKLSTNPSVKRILDEELSAEELSEMESLVMADGKTTAQSDVLRGGNSADSIIAGITNSSPEQRAKLRSDPAYLMLLKERLQNPDDYRKAIDALMSNRAGDDKLAAVDTHATKKEPRELLRDLVELDVNELQRLQADPELQAKLLASFSDPEQRRVARELLNTKLKTQTKSSELKTPEQVQEAQKIDEENRLAFLAANAVARLRLPLKDKLGWPTMLDQCIEVYKMELEPRLEVDKTKYLDEHGIQGRKDDQGKKLYVAHFNQEHAMSRASRASIGNSTRSQIWEKVDDDVRAWSKIVDKPKDRTLSQVYEPAAMVKIVEQAVLKQADPSAERIRENLGATVKRPDLHTGMEHDVELDDDDKGLKQAIRNASNDIWIDSWSNVIQPAKDGSASLATIYKEYKDTVDAQNKVEPRADGKVDPEAQRKAGNELHKKKQAFIDYTIDISGVFEELVLPNVGSSDERTLTKDGGTSRLRERDNKKYNELVDIGRERLQSLYKGDGKYLIANKIGITDPKDFNLLDTPNRDEVTAFAFRDSKYLRSRGTQAGSGWAADDEAQVVDQRMMQYGHLLAESRTNDEGARGEITGDEAVKLQESGAELDRALQAFKDAKAKVAFWMSLIVKVLVTVILTALTGPLAGGPLVALFFTTAIAGASAGASALINEAVLAEDYDLKDEGVKMIGKEMLTAFITAGTTMLAQKMLAGVSGLTALGRQARAAEQVMKTPPPMWRGFLHEASEEVLSETMSGIVDAGLIAIDPVHWMHGVNEGRDRAFPLAWDELSKVPSRALMAGLSSAATSGFTKLTQRKGKLKKLVQEAEGKPINVRQSFKKVLGGNHERVISTLTEYFMEKGLDVDLDNLAPDLLEGFLNEVNEASIEMHTGSWHEGKRGKRAEAELTKHGDKLTSQERTDFKEMHARANSTDPYITIQEYINIRDKQAVDAVYAWQERNPDKKLSPEDAKAFIWHVRGATEPDDFRARLAKGPDQLEQSVKDDYEKHVQEKEEKAREKAEKDSGKTADKTSGKTVNAAGQATTVAKPPAVAVVQEVASVEEGYALMRRLAGGDQSALSGAREGFKHEGRTDAIEWGLGQTRDGKVVLLRGEAGAVDFDKIPGITALAHSHPAVLGTESRDLKLAAQNPTGIPIAQLLDDANSMDLVKFLPSTGDLGYLAESSVGSHVVFTPYMHVGDMKVGNPSPNAPPEQRIEIVINNPRLVGRSLIQRHQGAYSANIIIRTGDGTVLWSGPMYAVKLQSDAFTADQPSLAPKHIEMGMMPEPKPQTDDSGDTLEAGGLDKYKVPKKGKKEKAQAGIHAPGGTNQQRPKSAADVFAGETPAVGEQWSFQSASGNFYRGRYQGVDENGMIMIETADGIGRLDPGRLASARRGPSLDALHPFGPKDRITLYSVRGNPRTGAILGYDDYGNVLFKTDQGEVQRLIPGELDLNRIEQPSARQQPARQQAPAQQQQQPQQHQNQPQQQQQQARAPRTAADVFDGQAPMQGELWTFKSGSDKLYMGRYVGVDETGHILLETAEGVARFNPERLVSARRGASVPELHGYGPNDRITLYSVRNNPRTGVIVGYDEQGRVHFRTDSGEIQVLFPKELNLKRIEVAQAPNPQAPSVSDAHVGDPRVGGLVHAGENAQAHVALASQLGVMPSEVVTVGGATFKVGKLFDIGDGRVGALIEVEVNGQRYMRVAYRSNSQGGFRVLPARNEGVPYVPGYDKAIGEHAIMLPNEVEEALSRNLVAGKVKRDITQEQADKVFEGAVPVNRSMGDWMNFQNSPDHIKHHVTEQQILTEAKDTVKTSGGNSLPVPGQVTIAEQAHRPNFKQLVRTYSTSTSVAGDVTAMVYRSHDGSLEYVLYKDTLGRVWIKSVSKVDSEITAQGVRSVAIDADALCTPLWEYAKQVPHGYAGARHPTQPNYVDAWKYLSQLPEIRAFYEQTGTPMPGEPGVAVAPANRPTIPMQTVQDPTAQQAVDPTHVPPQVGAPTQLAPTVDAQQVAQTQNDAEVKAQAATRELHQTFPDLQHLSHLSEDVLGAHQRGAVEAKLRAMTTDERMAFQSLLGMMSTQTGRGFLYKALAAGNSIDSVQWLAMQTMGRDDAWLLDNLTLSDPRGVGAGIMQQWSMGCNSAMTLCMRGNYDPVFALGLRISNPNISRADLEDPRRFNSHLATMEGNMLQSAYQGEATPEAQGWGGIAVPHAQGESRGRWADDLLNQQSDVTGLQFTTQKNINPADALVTLDTALQQGMQVPIVVGTQERPNAHYLLVTLRRVGADGVQWYRIHDTATGSSTWVTEHQIMWGQLPFAPGNLITAVERPRALDQSVPQAARAQATTDAHVTPAQAPMLANSAVSAVSGQIPTSVAAQAIAINIGVPVTPAPQVADAHAAPTTATRPTVLIPVPVQEAVAHEVHPRAVGAAQALANVDPARARFTEQWKDAPIDIARFKQQYDLEYEDAQARIERVKQSPEIAAVLDRVPEEELVAIILYTSTHFVEWNNTLREKKTGAEGLAEHGAGIALADKGLAKMPKYSGTVYRGTTLPADVIAKYVPGQMVTEDGFTSTSTEESGTENFEGNVRFVIESKTGRSVDSLSRYDNEKEILFRPGTKFVITDKVREGDGYVITMKEVSEGSAAPGGPGGAGRAHRADALGDRAVGPVDEESPETAHVEGGTAGRNVYRVPFTEPMKKGKAGGVDPTRVRKLIAEMADMPLIHDAKLTTVRATPNKMQLTVPNLVDATASKTTVTINLVVTARDDESTWSADASRGVHGGDGGPARHVGLTRSPDGRWSVDVVVNAGLQGEDVHLAVEHELNEIADIVARNPTGGPDDVARESRAGVFRRGGPNPAVTSHDRAAARELASMDEDLRNAKSAYKPNEEDIAEKQARIDRMLTAMGLDDPAMVTAEQEAELTAAGVRQQLLADIASGETAKRRAANYSRQLTRFRGAQPMMSAGTGFAPGEHGRSKHWESGQTRGVVLSILNKPQRIFTGTYEQSGRAVDIYWVDGSVVITEAGQKDVIITAYGPAIGGPDEDRVETAQWETNPAYREIKS